MTIGYAPEELHNPEAERGVIGSLLLDNGSFDRISTDLLPEHFFDRRNREIFTEIARQLGAGKQCDVLTVAGALGGGHETVMEVQEYAALVLSAANLRRYAGIIIERARARNLMLAATRINEIALRHETGIEERIEQAQSLLTQLSHDAPRDEWVPAYEAMVQHTALLEERAEGKRRNWGTGLHLLDDYLEGGLKPGSLVVIGARPSMGKTAMGMTIGVHMAREFAVGMLSMEMPHAELRDRLTAMLGRVSLSHVIRPQKGLDWDKVVAGAELARGLNFYASDQGGLNINQVRAKARGLKRLHGINVLIVDYIGLMSGLDPRQNRAYQIEEISRGLKALAKELDICVLCLAQVNRGVADRVDQMPSLSDLRDSGAIEQDADVVLFVHRPIMQKPDLGPEWECFAQARIAKNRQGRCGAFSLFYRGDQTRFECWDGTPPAGPQRGHGRGLM